MGVGAGTYLASSFAVVQALVPVHDLSNAVGFMSVGQDLGIVVFLAVAGTVYQNTAIKNIMKSVPGTSIDEVFKIIAGTSNPAFTTLPPDVQTEVVAQIIKAMSGVWALLIAGMALSFILSLFLGVSYSFMFEEHQLMINSEGKVVHGRRNRPAGNHSWRESINDDQYLVYISGGGSCKLQEIQEYIPGILEKTNRVSIGMLIFAFQFIGMMIV